MSAWLLARTARHEAPAEPRGIAQVRHEARKTLDDWQLGEVADAAELAVSEMLTNALHYGHTEILALELSLDEPWLCLSVADANPTPPYPCRPDEKAEGGRGVLLMAELADAWGFRATSVGKSVFAEFRTSPSPNQEGSSS
jgi:anti-sigma regulatory factor (Ser/Thr protein kinase)